MRYQYKFVLFSKFPIAISFNATLALICEKNTIFKSEQKLFSCDFCVRKRLAATGKLSANALKMEM